MLAIPDSLLAIGGFAVAVVIVVAVVMAFRTGSTRRDHTASPPQEDQQDYRKPHD